MIHSNGNCVAVVYDILFQMIKPCMDVTKEWGDLPKSEMGLDIKKNFQGDFDTFVTFLQSEFCFFILFFNCNLFFKVPRSI